MSQFKPSFRYFALAFLLIIIAGFKIHGFSISAWHEYIDDSPEDSVIVGQYRGYRADDWSIYFPLIFSQYKNNFKTYTPLVGSGEQIGVLFRTPIFHWSTFFRPNTWGFFIGPDIGMSYLWWFLVLGSFFAFYFLIRELFENFDQKLAMILSGFYTLSPFLQIWSYYQAEIYLHALFAVYCFIRVLKIPHFLRAIPWLLLGLWSFLATLLSDLYPPKIITMTYFILFCFLGWIIENKMLKTQKLKIFGSTLMIGCLTGLILFFFYGSFHEIFESLSQTTYPGRRVSVGGGLPFWSLFSDWFQQPLLAKSLILGNECENASIAFSFILTFPVIIYCWIKKLVRPNFIILSLMIYASIMICFKTVGFPKWLSIATGFSFNTSNRTVIGIVLADLIVLSYFIHEKVFEKVENKIKVRFLILSALMLLISFGHIIFWSQDSKYTWPKLALMFLCGIILFWRFFVFAYHSENKIKNFSVFAILSVLPAMTYNPWASGGYQFIVSNELSQSIVQESQKTSDWRMLIVGSTHLSNLPRILGVKSWGGYLVYPDRAMNQLLDPEGRFQDPLNQAAYFIFELTQQKTIQISPTIGLVKISIPVGFLEKLNIQAILVVGDEQNSIFTQDTDSQKFRMLKKTGNSFFYVRQ